MYVTQEELNRKAPTEIISVGKSYLVDKIQTSTHGLSHRLQTIRVLDKASNAFKVQTEYNGIFWWDKKGHINIVEKL